MNEHLCVLDTAPAYGGDTHIWEVLQAYFNEDDLVLASSFLEAGEISESGGGHIKPCIDTGDLQTKGEGSRPRDS